jgi:SAM dependent carboxyl methyltransferase
MERTTSASGAMEGRGADNIHAKLPATGATLALPLLEEAIKSLPIEAGDQPIVIADYGASQGRNSLAPLRLAIGALRARAGPERPILVYQQDLPANDFNALFRLLDSDSDSYARSDPKVFPCAIGRSFYGAVLPPEHVNVGWSSYAVMWASRVPSLIPGHISVLRASGATRVAFDRQGAEDWETFLKCRSVELRPGGRLVVVLPAAEDDGLTGFETIMDFANDTITEMVTEGAISADEHRRMVLAVWPRQKRELMAPFIGERSFQGLTVEQVTSGRLWRRDYQNGIAGCRRSEPLLREFQARTKQCRGPDVSRRLRYLRKIPHHPSGGSDQEQGIRADVPE